MTPYGIKLSVKLPAIVILGVVLTALITCLLAIFIGTGMIRERALEANINGVHAYASAISWYVTDRRGLIIAHQGTPRFVEEQTDFSAVQPVRAALAGKDGALQFYSPIRQVEMLGAYSPLPATGWAVVYVTPVRVADAPIDSLTRQILLASTGLAILLGFLGFGVVRRIVGPISQVEAAAQALGKGDLNQRIEVRTGDEIESLANAFNRMTANLLEKDHQLRQRTAELEASNKELEAFSYSASHDLRGPLRAIDGFSRILLEDYESKLDAEGKRPLNVIRTTVAPLPDGAGDAVLLRQVWSNLLSNAVKFTLARNDQRIDITGHTEGDMNIYSIRDTGVGFNPKYTNKLFGIFQRLHKTEGFEGNGVGLAIVRHIIDRHGGRVWAEGQINEGAVFSFSLPCKETKETL